MKLRPFQKEFIEGAFAEGIDTAALSIPRGNGEKLSGGSPSGAGHDPWRRSPPGGLRVFAVGPLRSNSQELLSVYPGCSEETGEYRFLDSSTRVGVTHKPTNTRLRVLSSKAKSAFGIVGCSLLVADEPGAWENQNGAMMYDAISTAQGNPDLLFERFTSVLWLQHRADGGTILSARDRTEPPTSRRSREILKSGTSGPRSGAAIP